MQASLQIAFHNLEGSDSIRGLIEEKVAWLERFYDRITGCRVVVEAPHKHHRNGNQYQVCIDLTVPGGEIVVNREPSAAQQQQQRTELRDLPVVIRDAFDAARRKLEEHVRRTRREVKSHQEASAPRARVSQLFAEEGYGFLTTLIDAREIYFHRRAVLNGGFDELRVGAEVAFIEEEGEKGPQASTVRPLGRHNHSRKDES
jgi:cold shock CspA family protein